MPRGTCVAATQLLTKKQIRNLNRRFGLGVYRKRTIADYPVLHAYLAKVFEGAHNQLLAGTAVKLTLGQPWILNMPRMYERVITELWLERIGAYRIEACDASTQYVSLKVGLPDKKDIFYPDDFVVLTSHATCQIYVSDKGKLGYIDLHFNTRSPTFIRVLARNFSLGGRCARQKLRKRIRHLGEEPDDTFLAPIKFGRAVTIQFDDDSL